MTLTFRCSSSGATVPAKEIRAQLRDVARQLNNRPARVLSVHPGGWGFALCCRGRRASLDEWHACREKDAIFESASARELQLKPRRGNAEGAGPVDEDRREVRCAGQGVMPRSRSRMLTPPRHDQA